MERRPLIAGNWKMHMTIAESEQLAAAVVAASEGRADREVMIAPPYTALAATAKVLAGSDIEIASARGAAAATN